MAVARRQGPSELSGISGTGRAREFLQILRGRASSLSLAGSAGISAGNRLGGGAKKKRSRMGVDWESTGGRSKKEALQAGHAQPRPSRLSLFTSLLKPYPSLCTQASDAWHSN